MKTVIELDDAGVLHLPAALLPVAKPRARYHVETGPDNVILSPAPKESTLWGTLSTEAWITEFSQWAHAHRMGPGLPNSAVSRDAIDD